MGYFLGFLLFMVLLFASVILVGAFLPSQMVSKFENLLLNKKDEPSNKN